MNTPVSFEIAKLLKEKGLDIEKPNFYNSHGQLKTTVQDFFIPRYEAPNIAEVVMWLYEKHEIFIQLFPIGEDGKMKFYSKIIVNDNGWIKIASQISNIVNSPTEAYEAAIIYTLKNLI